MAANGFMRNMLLALSVCLALFTFASARSISRSEDNAAFPGGNQAIAHGIPLRILPLGDSITFGYGSTDGNGYRNDLLNLLTARKSKVTYIGSVKSGNMTNNENDGFPGFTISQIATSGKPELSQKPNVILLHAGTNDMNDSPPPEPYATAPQRLGSLIDELVAGVPRTTIIVAQIISSTNAGTKDRIPVYDAAIPNVVAQRARKGAKVLTVDMESIPANFDGLHPNDAGYQMMANVWLQGLQQASRRGWITPAK